jgi:SAM-dependent methyltransferase
MMRLVVRLLACERVCSAQTAAADTISNLCCDRECAREVVKENALLLLVQHSAHTNDDLADACNDALLSLKNSEDRIGMVVTELLRAAMNKAFTIVQHSIHPTHLTVVDIRGTRRLYLHPCPHPEVFDPEIKRDLWYGFTETEVPVQHLTKKSRRELRSAYCRSMVCGSFGIHAAVKFFALDNGHGDTVVAGAANQSAEGNDRRLEHQQSKRLKLNHRCCGSECAPWQQGPWRVLCLGLGGGAIVAFLLGALANASVVAVEVSPLVAKAALEHFDLSIESIDGRTSGECSTECSDGESVAALVKKIAGAGGVDAVGDSSRRLEINVEDAERFLQQRFPSVESGQSDCSGGKFADGNKEMARSGDSGETNAASNAEEQFDVVLVDLYSDGHLPPFFDASITAPACTSAAAATGTSPLQCFCRHLRRAVRHDGTVALNLPSDIGGTVQQALCNAGFGFSCLAPLVDHRNSSGWAEASDGRGDRHSTDGGTVVLAGSRPAPTGAELRNAAAGTSAAFFS